MSKFEVGVPSLLKTSRTADLILPILKTMENSSPTPAPISPASSRCFGRQSSNGIHCITNIVKKTIAFHFVMTNS